MNTMMKARKLLITEHPFFASTLLQMKTFPDKETTSNTFPMWTDGRSIGYDPDIIEEWGVEKTMGVLCHEVLHVNLLHHTRRKGRVPLIWNCAGDFTINLILLKSKINLPEPCLCDYQYDGMFTEEVYALLVKNAIKIEIPWNDGENGKNGEIKINGENEKNSKKIYPYGGEIRDFKGTTSEIAEEEASQIIKVKRALVLAKAAGKLPGHLAQIFEKIGEPQLPWQSILSRFIDEQARNDYSYKVPDRYYLPDIYLPSLQNPELGPVCLILDTSGSISQEMCQSMIDEIVSLIGLYTNTRLTILQVDTIVQDEIEIESGDLTKIELKGGGGTDFRPGFEHLANRDYKIIIYFTDGYCNHFPEREPDCPVLWILLEENTHFSPPFGEIVVRGLTN